MSFRQVLKEIWSRRSLIWIFAVNDLKLRYRNSVLGFFWSFLEPLLLLAILYVVFTQIFSSKVEEYPLYLLSGLILWNLFSRSTSSSLQSMLIKSGIITKIYFPREILVLSSVLTSFIMFSFEIVVFFIFMVAFQFVPSASILFLPIPMAFFFLLILGVSFALSVTNVFFRDIQSIWAILLQAGFFITPIIYRLDMFPQTVQKILHYSPLVQIFEMIHNAILYHTLPNSLDIGYTFFISVIILIIGYSIFHRFEAKAVEEL